MRRTRALPHRRSPPSRSHYAAHHSFDGRTLTHVTAYHPGLGTGRASSYMPRNMTMVSDALAYNAYLDATRVSLWGDGTGGTSSYGPVTPPDGVNVTVTVYGRAAIHQDVSVGNYDDLITATMSF